MPLRPTLALCALLSLPLLAGADDQAPSPDQVMSEHKAEIDNRLADIDYKRKRIVEANMNLTGKEGEAFWPIYNTYRSEAEKLSKQHLALILDYAKSYNTGKVSDKDASALLKRAGERGLANLRIVAHDAVEVLQHMVPPGSLAGVHIFFPDPWHKKRHHKRRLVTPGFAHLAATRLQVGASWRLATDWADYAEQMVEVLDAEPLLDGGATDRWAERPVTRFERKGVEAGRDITDLRYVRV